MTDRINYQARAPIPKGAKPTARYTYRDEQGHPLFLGQPVRDRPQEYS